MTLLEICLDDPDGAAVAEAAGADRLELCAALGDGGLTPSIGTVEVVLGSVHRVGVQVLIRQRPGDFVYSEVELAAMVADIRAIAGLARGSDVAVGFVVGALAPRGTIDRRATARLVEAADGLPVTFHKAFDQVPDLPAGLDELVELGICRVLTSGGEPTALAGAEVLAQLVDRSQGRIAILAGGGIRADHVAALVERTGVAEVHLRAGAPVPRPHRARSPRAEAAAAAYAAGERIATSAALVAGVRASLDHGRPAA